MLQSLRQIILEFSDFILLARGSNEYRILTKFIDHLVNSCWTDNLGHAVWDLNIFNHVTYDMFGWMQAYERTCLSLTNYYEWTYNQASNYDSSLVSRNGC